MDPSIRAPKQLSDIPHYKSFIIPGKSLNVEKQAADSDVKIDALADVLHNLTPTTQQRC